MEKNFSFFHVRWEVVIISWFSFSVIFFLDFFFPNVQKIEHFDQIVYHILLISSISFFVSVMIEFFYYVSNLISALLLRLRNLWKYSIPSILIFSLFVFPLFDLTELKFSFYQLEGLKGDIYIAILGAILIISIILILIFPIFYGLNGGFIIISCFFSYLLNKFILYKYFNHYSIIYFLILYYIFVYLFYFYLQLRRRLGLNLYYEQYHYPKWFVVSFVGIFLILFYFKSILYDILVYYILFSIFLAFSLINLLLSMHINFEYKLQKRLFVCSYIYLFIILFIKIIIIFFLYYNFPKDFRTLDSKNIISYYFLETVHFLYDKDGDGENHFFGSDPDDKNFYIRSEGKFNELNKSYELKTNQNNDYYIFTLFFNEGSYASEIHRIAPSNNIALTLFSLLNNLSSFESYLFNHQKLDKEIQSLFSILTTNYYRTICIGYDANQKYFGIKSNIRIDKGCEIFLPFEENSNSKNDLEHLIHFINFSKQQFLNYKKEKNLLWLHYDFTNQNKIEKTNIISLIEKEIPFSPILFRKNYKYIYLIFFNKPVPHYQVQTNIDNLSILMNKKFSNYGILYRLIYYNEIKTIFYDEAQILQHPFFVQEFEYSKKRDLNHYTFIEPEDHYWKELIKIFQKPIIPPISVIEKNKEIQIYDGRSGFKAN